MTLFSTGGTFCFGPLIKHNEKILFESFYLTYLIAVIENKSNLDCEIINQIFSMSALWMFGARLSAAGEGAVLGIVRCLAASDASKPSPGVTT